MLCRNWIELKFTRTALLAERTQTHKHKRERADENKQKIPARHTRIGWRRKKNVYFAHTVNTNEHESRSSRLRKEICACSSVWRCCVFTRYGASVARLRRCCAFVWKTWSFESLCMSARICCAIANMVLLERAYLVLICECRECAIWCDETA